MPTSLSSGNRPLVTKRLLYAALPLSTHMLRLFTFDSSTGQRRPGFKQSICLVLPLSLCFLIKRFPRDDLSESQSDLVLRPAILHLQRKSRFGHKITHLYYGYNPGQYFVVNNLSSAALCAIKAKKKKKQTFHLMRFSKQTVSCVNIYQILRMFLNK